MRISYTYANHMTKAVRRLTELQSTSCKTDQKTHVDFAKLLKCARFFASLFVSTPRRDRDARA
jgi:hypothetical protein